jgi:hypothetical protein
MIEELLNLASDLNFRCFEAEKALLEQGIMFSGVTFRRLRAEKAVFTRKINTIRKEYRRAR